MSFPQHLIADHEKLVFERRPHWIALVPAAAWTIVLLGALYLGYGATDAIFDQSDTIPNGVVGAVVTGLWIWLAVTRFLRWRFTLFVLTTDRIITRRGVIAKDSKEIPLESINDVAFHQTVLERIVGAGDIILESGGEYGQSIINDVRKPEEVHLLIYREAEKNSARMFGGGSNEPASSDESIPGQIAALAKLKEEGSISDVEFETKKKELLDRM